MPIEKPWFTAWVDDDGSGNVGTIWNKAEIAKLINGLDASLHCVGQYSPADTAIAAGWSIPNIYGLDIDQPPGGGSTPGRITIPAGGGGLYQVNASIVFAAAASGTLRGVQINLSGAAMLTGQTVANAQATVTITLAGIMNLSGGHVLELNTYCAEATSIKQFSRWSAARM